MYTQCGRCLARYEVSAQDLAAAAGDARCGRCGHVFSMLERLADALPEDGEFEINEGTSIPVPLDDDALIEPAETGELFHFERSDAWEEFADNDEWEESDADLSDFVEPPRRPRAIWRVGSVLLFLALVTQLAIFYREPLLRYPPLRPLLVDLCERLGCEVPMQRDLTQLRLVERNIRQHPSVPDALMISATLRNEAEFPQPFPSIEIELSDLQGEPVAMRRFDASEYVESTEARSRGMPPQVLVPVIFEVVDPENAVAFEFAFR